MIGMCSGAARAPHDECVRCHNKGVSCCGFCRVYVVCLMECVAALVVLPRDLALWLMGVVMGADVMVWVAHAV